MSHEVTRKDEKAKYIIENTFIRFIISSHVNSKESFLDNFSLDMEENNGYDSYTS